VEEVRPAIGVDHSGDLSVANGGARERCAGNYGGGSGFNAEETERAQSGYCAAKRMTCMRRFCDGKVGTCHNQWSPHAKLVISDGCKHVCAMHEVASTCMSDPLGRRQLGSDRGVI
jgi:hypothetical protein